MLHTLVRVTVRCDTYGCPARAERVLANGDPRALISAVRRSLRRRDGWALASRFPLLGSARDVCPQCQRSELSSGMGLQILADRAQAATEPQITPYEPAAPELEPVPAPAGTEPEDLPEPFEPVAEPEPDLAEEPAARQATPEATAIMVALADPPVDRGAATVLIPAIRGAETGSHRRLTLARVSETAGV